MDKWIYDLIKRVRTFRGTGPESWLKPYEIDTTDLGEFRIDRSFCMEGESNSSFVLLYIIESWNIYVSGQKKASFKVTRTNKVTNEPDEISIDLNILSDEDVVLLTMLFA